MSRRRTATKNAVAASSVWENRMKLEDGNGGIKPSNGVASCKEEGGGRGSVGLRVYRRLKRNQSDSAVENRSRSKLEAEKNPIQLRKTRSDSQRISDENCKLGVCKDKNLKGSMSNVGQITSPKVAKDDIPDANVEEEEKEEEEEEEFEEEEEVEVEKERFDIKEMNTSDEMVRDEIVREVGEEEKQHHQIHDIPFSANAVTKPIHVIDHPSIDEEFTKPPPVSVADAFERIHEGQNRMQNLVDLVMWRDISKSALIFGLGTFILVSSSYTKDVNFSFISAISYLGLVYLAAKFFYKSIICRGAVDFMDSEQKHIILGEEEVIWILKLILPYFNEVLFKIRCLFSGDPATTMKLAILLFVLARCGSSITIWKMARLAFFGVFTLPKICSTYSHQLSSYGNFWLRRFRDAWDSCTHKKAVGIGIFTVIWNLSSVVARIWAVFFLIVSVRFYQQSFVRDEWAVEEAQEDLNNGGQEVRQKGGPTLIEKNSPTTVELTKEKKGS
eukprot:TRINITY_DN15069_c0_g1_i1.p1 TRINITY_DN15069_c0_g1~~TRINITY_DN15069_c0_g1_i1.p1  ORF type:complete len:501 (+),score=140.71 TRINITY_DN15069_c0_g1_i1:320-1822(+)